MEEELFNYETWVLYQNRFCDHENFDFVITGLHDCYDHLKSIYNVKGPSLTSVDNLVSKLCM